MVEYLLGNFLVKSGKMDTQTLDTVIEKMDTVRVKLGLIAVAEGFMTEAQADEVNSLQAIMDKRYGDIAIEKGYLTDEQVGKLLKKQGNAYLLFAQTLVNEGILDLNDLYILLEQFRLKNGFTNSELEAIKSDDIDAIVSIMLADGMDNLGELVGTAVRSIIRLVDRHAYMGKVVLSEKKDYSGCAIQEMQGTEANEFTFMVEKDGGLINIASVFGQMEFNELDEDALDASAEFINVINGMYASSRSKEGQFLELMPPSYATDNLTVPASKIYQVPISVKGKNFILGVAKTV